MADDAQRQMRRAVVIVGVASLVVPALGLVVGSLAAVTVFGPGGGAAVAVVVVGVTVGLAVTAGLCLRPVVRGLLSGTSPPRPSPLVPLARRRR